MYDFETKRIIGEIKKRKASKVLLQLPEGLKQYAEKLMKELKEKTNAEIALSGDPCYGACDIQTIPGFLTVHYGHSKMLENKNVIYAETRSDLEVITVVEKALNFLCEKVGLVTTVQHIHKLDEVKKFLENKGKRAVIGRKGNKATYDGQVLGCDAGSAASIANDVDCFLFIGSGKFHPLLVAYTTKKKIIQANPYNEEVTEVSAGEWEKEKWLRISKASKAKTFGVIASTKPGQQQLQLAEKLCKEHENTYLVIMNEITPERIDYLPFDAFVITACPRIVLDDWKNYEKPILLPNEFVEVKKPY